MVAIPRTAEVVYVGRPEDLLAANAKVRVDSEATAAASRKSYGEMVAAGDAAGKAAAEHAASMGASLAEQNAAYDRAAKAAGVASDEITAAAKRAGDAAAKEAAAIGGSLDEQRAAYARAATAAKEHADVTSASADRAAVAQDLAAAKTAKAHDKMMTSAQKSAEAFGKWGTAAAVGVVAGSIDMALKVEKAAAAIAIAGDTSTAAGKKIVDAFKGAFEEHTAAEAGQAYASIAGELKVVESHALDAAEALKVMKAATNLADATGGSINSTTEALGKAMLTFGLNSHHAAEASDILFTASKATGTQLESLVQTVDRMHGRLGALGPSLQETTGLMVELAKQGISGRQSLSTLNGVFTTLIGGGKKTQEMAKELGLEIFNSSHQFVGLSSVIDQLHPKFARLTQESQLQAAKALFGAAANKQLIQIIDQGPAAFEAATKAVQAHGAAAAGAAKEHQTLAAKAKAAETAAEELGASIGEKLLPDLTKLATGLEDGVKWLQKHETAAKALGIVITGVLGVAVLDFAVVKAKKYAESIGTMVNVSKLLAEKMGITAAAIKTADGEIVMANEAAATSFGKMTTAVEAFGAAAAVAYSAYLVGKTAFGGNGEEPFGNPFGRSSEKHGETSGEAARTRALRKENAESWVLVNGKMVHEMAGGGGNSALTGNEGGGIMGYFMAKGLSAAQAAGIVGNFQQESSMNPSYSSSEGTGLDSGTGSRAHSGTTKQQIEAIWKELETSEQATLVALKAAKSPQEAARIFSKRFERPSQPELSKREKYAAEAYASHPQAHHPKHAAQSTPYGSESIAAETTTKAGTVNEYLGPNGEVLHETSAQHAHRSLMERKAKLEGAYVSPLAHPQITREDMGLDFAAHPGEAVKAIGSGIIDTIVKNWYKGESLIEEKLTSGSHKGQYVYYAEQINPSVHQGQLVKAGQTVATVARSGTGLEFGFGAGGGRTLAQARNEFIDHAGNDPTQASKAYAKFLASIGKSGSEIQLASSQFSAAMKAAEKLTLTHVQQAGVHGLKIAANHAQESVTLNSGYATQAESLWSHTRTLQELKRQPLYTAAGAHEQTEIDEQDILTAKARKIYYAREVKALQREVTQWGKLRDRYRKFARHSPAGSGARKQALNKASEYEGKIEAAKKEAQALQGTIADTEAQIDEAQQALTGTLPTEIAAAQAEHQGADLSGYQAANSKIDLEQRAGILTEEQAKAAKEANARNALSGGYGELSTEGELQVKGDLNELAKAAQNATSALEAHTEALKESAKTLNEFNRASERIAETENTTLVKAMADLISGQIGGIDYHGRAITAGAGTAARY